MTAHSGQAQKSGLNHAHFGHALMPQLDHDEQALEDHFLAMRMWTVMNVDPLDRRLVDEVVAPTVEKETGKKPSSSAHIRKPLEAEPFHQFWLTLQMHYADQIWRGLEQAIDRQSDNLMERWEELTSNPVGSLTLDPDLVPPRYLGAFDHHRMPGSYYTDTCQDDIKAGAMYDRFASSYLRNLNGGWKNDGRGHTLASHVHDFFPDLKPKRILDMGCSVGHSTLAVKAAFPDAEVYAIDVGAPMLRYGHARAEDMGLPIHFSQQNAECTNFEDESFDLVYSSAALHETSARGMQNIFAECRRLLRPGGVMAHVDVPPRAEHLSLWDQMRCDFESHYNNEPFMATLARTDFEKVCRAAGFEKEEVVTGYRKGTPVLNPDRDAFFTEGHPEGRTLLGSWYVCSLQKAQ